MEMEKDIFLIESDVQTRWINAENPHGERGGACRGDIPETQRLTHPARELGKGFKIAPNITIQAGQVVTIANIQGSGVIRHIWMTTTETVYRNLILRIYWENFSVPSVECPLGDFFFQGWGEHYFVNTVKVMVNPKKGFNCLWDMPFCKGCKMTVENRGAEDSILFYQIDYELRKLPENIGYFHALFKRCEVLPYAKDFTMLDICGGEGKIVGTYLAYGARNNGWWGEGELKIYLDGDSEHPTLCSTGTEDYFLGAYDFENKEGTAYQEYAGMYTGFYRVKTDRLYNCMPRFGMYRLHINDPICFRSEIKMDLQSIGWRSQMRFHPQQDDLASTVFFYLKKPLESIPPLQSADELENI